MAAIPHGIELLSSINMHRTHFAFSQMKENTIPKNSKYSVGSITRSNFVTGVRFVPAAPQLPALVVRRTKSIFDDKDHI